MPRPCTFFLMIFLVIAAASGCGGGGGAGSGAVSDGPGSARSPTTGPIDRESIAGSAFGGLDPMQLVVIRSFADGSGVVRARQNGVNHVVITPQGAGFGAGRTGISVDPSSLMVLAEPANGTLYQAQAVDGDGAPLVVALYRANGATGGEGCAGQACAGPGVAYLRPLGGGSAEWQAFGAPAQALPSGRHDYTGLHLVGLAGDAGLQQGSFVLSVDFDLARAAISARSESFQMSGSGIVVNMDTGTLSGGALSLSGVGPGLVPVRLDGTLHGSGATGVSAIYHEDAPLPRVMGAVAGTR